MTSSQWALTIYAIGAAVTGLWELFNIRRNDKYREGFMRRVERMPSRLHGFTAGFMIAGSMAFWPIVDITAMRQEGKENGR